MIELTIQQLINCSEILKKLLNMSFPVYTSYKIMRIAREVEKEYNFYSKTREALIQKYTEKTEEGQPITDENGNYKIILEKAQEFSDEYQKMLDTSLQLLIEPIPLEELEKIELTPYEIIQLEPFIK